MSIQIVQHLLEPMIFVNMAIQSNPVVVFLKRQLQIQSSVIHYIWVPGPTGNFPGLTYNLIRMYIHKIIHSDYKAYSLPSLMVLDMILAFCLHDDTQNYIHNSICQIKLLLQENTYYLYRLLVYYYNLQRSTILTTAVYLLQIQPTDKSCKTK